ncbi:MAG: DUF433 domain-containing protein [Deltaproteobacteria bacterium]|nr:DUF433 domain-containing protein [Deltaproteobacteria bacterium]
MVFKRITVNAAQMGGMPCLRGLRIPVATVKGDVVHSIQKSFYILLEVKYFESYVLPLPLRCTQDLG